MDLLKRFLVFAMISLAPPEGTKSAVFIDRSGSMKPYYQHEIVRQLGNAVVDAVRPHGEVTLYAFSNSVQLIKRLEDLAELPYGSSTLLDGALDRAVKDGASVAWMITDNIQQAPGSTEAGDTEQFYKGLRSDAVEKVTIFPLRQQAGNPGLVVYALLMAGGDSELYEKELAGFRSRATGSLTTDALRMKPLDKDTIGLSWVRANVNPRTSLITYDTGVPIRELINVRLKSNFDHIEIADASIDVEDAAASFGPGSLVYPEKREIEISPRTVKLLGPGDETDQVYDIDVNLGRLKLRHDLASLWTAAWVRSSEDATLQVSLIIRVPQKNFRLRQKFLQDYSAATLDEATRTGKVYAIDRLPTLMSEAVTEVRVATPVVFRVRYPAYPTFLWLGFFFVCAVGIVGSFIAAKRGVGLFARSGWDVEAKTQAGLKLESAVDQGEVVVQKTTVGRLEKQRFVPAAGTRVMNPAGSDVRLADGVEVTLESDRRSIILTFKATARHTTSKSTSKQLTQPAPRPKRR